MTHANYYRSTVDPGDVLVCRACASVVDSTEDHDRWHEALEEAFKARDKSLNEAFDAVIEGFKARDTEFGRLADVLCGREPRKPHRIGKPMTDEQRAELQQILDALGVEKP